MKHRLLSWALVLAILCTMLPVQALASMPSASFNETITYIMKTFRLKNSRIGLVKSTSAVHRKNLMRSILILLRRMREYIMNVQILKHTGKKRNILRLAMTEPILS